MNQHKKELGLFIATIIFSWGMISGWNPFSKSDWEDVGGTIKGGFETFGEQVKSAFDKGVTFAGKVFHDAKSLAEEVFKKIEACTKVVPLGAEWTAKKAAYETAKATLQAADKLKVLDPRILAMQASEEAAKLSLQAAQNTLEGTKQIAFGLSKALEGIATGVKKGFNVKKVEFEAYMSKLLEAKAPRISFEAEMFGQSVTLKDFEFDFSNQAEAVKKIIKIALQKTLPSVIANKI